MSKVSRRRMFFAVAISAFLCGLFGVDWWQTALITAPFVVAWTWWAS